MVTRRGLWRPAFALIAALATCGILSVSVGAAYASGDALPGDPLYGLKRGIERARIALSLSSAGDAELLLGFANERLQEAEELVALGRVGDLEEALAGYEDALDALLALSDEIPVEGGPGSLAGVEDEISRNLIALERVRERVPAAAAEAIDRVIERALERQEEVEQTIEHGRPEGTPPGQIRQATREAGGGQGSGNGPDEDHGGGPPDRDKTPGPRQTPGPP
jgi:HAMP domain-containing protein